MSRALYLFNKFFFFYRMSLCGRTCLEEENTVKSIAGSNPTDGFPKVGVALLVHL